MTPTVHQRTGDSEDHDTDDTFCRSRPLFLLVMSGQADERAGTPHLQMNRQDFCRRIIRHVRTRRESRAVCIRRNCGPGAALSKGGRNAGCQMREKVNEAGNTETGNPHAELAEHACRHT